MDIRRWWWRRRVVRKGRIVLGRRRIPLHGIGDVRAAAHRNPAAATDTDIGVGRRLRNRQTSQCHRDGQRGRQAPHG
ncbi:Uncharacterised protein [Mycobacteroides abscessus subsp. abscessus]|nr:Uncharacterised protein [Mycobacteroides abscessus subsp. abscessus]